MGRFKIKVSRREGDWSPDGAPLLDAALQTNGDTPEFAQAPLQTTFDTPEFADVPLQTDTPEFADAPLQTPDTPEFAPRNG